MNIMKKNLLFIAFLSFFWTGLLGQNAWVNEIHYDNTGGDVNEFIEVVVENPGSYALVDFSVVLYNGSGGASYDTKTLDVFTIGSSNNGFTFYTYVYPVNGIQNGGTTPDGFALCYLGTVISGQFLSYEGSFTATNGPANGMTSTDIGVVELGTEPIGQSLQLSGTATNYAGFVWNAPATATPGALNNNQTFGTPATAARIVGSMQGWNTTDPAYVMAQNTNGLYELTKSLNVGDWEYKVLEGDAWGDEEFPSANQHVILSGTENVTWKANITANLVTHMLPVVTGDFLSELGGTDWNPGDLIGEMEDPDGDDIYTLELLIPAAGNFACKVTLNHNWDQSTGSNVSFTTDGINTTVFTYDFPNNTTTVTGPPPPTATITFEVNDSGGKNYNGFFLKGSWDVTGYYDASWGNGMEHSAFYDDGTHGDVTAGDHIWTCQQDLVVDDGANTWEWGVNDLNHNWITGNWQFTIPNEEPQTLSWIIPAQPAIVINEIMYNSPGDDEEWIELFNNSDETVSLENWKILDNDATHTPIIIPAGYSIDAYGYFTIEVGTFGAFPFTPDYDGSGSYNLGNSGDEINLYSNTNILTDKVTFTDTNPWPSAPDGNGPSLALIDPDSDNSLAASWAASLENGGTPGAINFPPIPFITVIDPNGGEYLVKGQPYEITWVHGYWENDVKIELLQEGFDPQLIATNIAVTQNSFNWVVWENQPVDTNYKIRISSLSPDEPSDESDGNFSIIDPYTTPNIVITEIMYNPPESGNDSLEFVELYNNGLETINLEGFYFSKGIEFTFPSVEILPDTFLLVAINSSAMSSTFGVQSLQWTSGALSNSGEDLELKDRYDNVVDFVPYDDTTPWDSLADGRGPSLTLCDPNADNALGFSWTASQYLAAINTAGDSIFATPGFECSIGFLGDFEADNTIVAVGNGVNFIDQTIGNPTTWMWIFEGGTPGTFEGQTPPEIIYDAPGTWDVTLEVSDGSNTDIVTYTDYIWSGYAPLAEFHADHTDVTVGTYLNFFSDATGDDLSFDWYFEGGTPETSNEENPSEIYYLIMDWATYDVTLIVSNPFGSDTMTKVDYIETFPESVPDRLNENDIRLYPNPNNGLFTIALPAGAEVEVIVMDISGRPVFTQQMPSGKIDLTGLQKGLYLVKLKDIASGNSFVKRLIIY